MSTFLNTTKTAVATFTNGVKNSATWDLLEKSGIGAWEYDEANFLYDSATDPDSGSAVYYNGIGTVSSFTNLAKS